MKKGSPVSMLVFLGITLFLVPNFYRNWWTAVEPGYYTEWQTRYDRLVVAKMVKTRQSGLFSAGGLMGLGDTDRWAFDTAINRDQFNTYLKNRSFDTYLVYKSNPGFQAIAYSLFDQVSPFSGEQNLKLMRGFTALTSALVLGSILTAIALQFGLLAGILAVIFSAFSMWTVLPAGSIFWSLWAFFLPFVAGAYALAEAARKNEYRPARMYGLLFVAILVKVLFSGFDLTTTVLVMGTVPFVFHAVLHRWNRKTFLLRFFKAGVALVAGTVTGLMILSLQIIASEGSLPSAYEYILNRFGSHAAGNYEYFTAQEVEVRPIHVMEVLPKYLLMPALDIHVRGVNFRLLYWHLIAVFAFFTLISLLVYRAGSSSAEVPRPTLALLAATWYSLLAPLSWYVLFRPHSYIHTHVNTMGWQMPFTILGIALCGRVLQELAVQFLASRRVRSALDAS